MNSAAELSDAVADIVTSPGKYAGMAREARAKLERELGTDRIEPGDDALTLHDFEAHEAIK